MISSLNGILRAKNPTEVLIEVGGIGYSVSIPLSTYEKLGEVNTPTYLLTYFHVRDDVHQLFGFSTEEERFLFKLLISVSGIGPRIAQGILSGVTVAELKDYIVRGNTNALTSIPNIGRKTSERLVIELRDKISKTDTGIGIPPPPGDQPAHARSEALLALTSLGFTRSIAEKALRQALTDPDGAKLSVEELIKRALRHASSK